MKFIKNIFDKARPHFEENGIFKVFTPLFEATENFFFSPDTKTIVGPHVRNSMEIKRYMSMVIVSLIPCVLAAFYFFGWRIIPLIITSYVVGGIVEVIVACCRKEEIQEGFLVTGLLFPLVLPPDTPLWVCAVGVAFGVFFGKEIFGGTGRNLFNPAILGRCFVGLAYAPDMAGWVEPGSGPLGRMLDFWPFSFFWGASAPEAISTATPLVAYADGSSPSYMEMFLGQTTGCIGETSTLAILIGAAILIFFKISNWRSTVATLISFSALSAIMYAIDQRSADPQNFPPVQYHLLAGGIMFGSVFMVTDPVTSPATNAGRIIYGIIIGSVTVLVRNLGGFPEGMMFAILLGNVCAPLIDEVIIRMHVKKFSAVKTAEN